MMVPRRVVKGWMMRCAREGLDVAVGRADGGVAVGREVRRWWRMGICSGGCYQWGIGGVVG